MGAQTKEPGPKKATAGVRQSAENVFYDAREVRKHVNQTWSLASKTPMFCKISKTKNGDTRRTTTRLISNTAYAIALSSSAHAVCQSVAAECDDLNLSCHEEKKTAPWLPNASAGAKILIEQFLASLAQEATYKAHAFRVASSRANPPKRLSRTHMKAGWKATIERVFSEGPLGSGISLPLNDVLERSKAVKTKPGAGKRGRPSAAKKAAEKDGDNFLPADEVGESLPIGKKSALNEED